MGNAASRNEHGNTHRKPATRHLSGQEEVVEEEEVRVDAKQQQQQNQDVIPEPLNKNVVRQTSVWSLGSLSGRFNWSFTGITRNSFRNRNKTTRKSLTTLQQRNCRSKTVWHKPLTNAIFSSHFKQTSRNEQFHIEQLVAKGAFGVVFKVIDKEHNAQQQQQQQQQQKSFGDSAVVVAVKPAVSTTSQPAYALKVLKKSKIIAENSIQQIKDEADIQKICGHHPFIVQQVDLWQNRRNLHILLEYVPNGELFSKITKFSVDLVRLYLAEIAIGIDFLHNAGIIYRDAKPENILLTESFHIKLTDFGLSKWLKLGVTTKTMCGTFQYMAPEILRGDAYGHAVDWWSLGIIACQMFTQTAPDIKHFLSITLPPSTIPVPTDSVDHRQNISSFISSSEPKSYKSQIKQQPFLPPEVSVLSHEAKDVLQRLLQLEPSQRIRSVLALQKIALYKNFKVDAKHLQSISPLKIISKDGLTLNEIPNYDECESVLATKAFQAF